MNFLINARAKTTRNLRAKWQVVTTIGDGGRPQDAARMRQQAEAVCMRVCVSVCVCLWRTLCVLAAAFHNLSLKFVPEPAIRNF